MRARYWSHSKIVKSLREALGFPVRPTFATSKEWRAYHKACKEHNEVLDYITDEMIDNIQDAINWPVDKLNDFSYWVYNRFIDETHKINTGLKPGQWHETEERILHGMFEELVDFVEVQKACKNIWCNDKDIAKFVPWWDKHLPYFLNKLIETRSQHLGVNYLLWETTLKKDNEWFGLDWKETRGEKDFIRQNPEYMKPTPQAEAALEILDLYVWWKFLRPMRPDPMDASGYTDYFNRNRTEDILDFESIKEDSTPYSQACHDLEEKYEKEDTEMMKRLIDVRRSMWT
jgi:hypothetical protein